MANFLSDLSDEGVEAASDYIGGFSALETALYLANLKMAYGGKSATPGSKAKSITFVFDLGMNLSEDELTGDTREYRETVWISGKSGDTWTPDKKDPKKHNPLMGFTIANDIALVTTGRPLLDPSQNWEEKSVKIYDYDQKKDVPKNVMVFMPVLGKQVRLGIQKIIDDITKKNDAGAYVPTGKTKEVNSINKVFHADSKMTVSEIVAGKQAEFYELWKERNTGKTINKAKGATPNGATGTGGGNAGSDVSSLFTKGG